MYQEESESELEFEQEEQEESESEVIEKKPKIKKVSSKKKKGARSNFYDYINKKCREK